MRTSRWVHLGIALGAAIAAPVGAATIVVPPVTITQLQHADLPNGTVRDGITIPGPGYTTDLFAATIATGDLIKVRVQAPPGKMFWMHGPGRLNFNLYWFANAGNTASFEEPHVVTFENRLGALPVQEYSFVTLGDTRQIVEVWKDYTVPGPTMFTAFTVDITATLPMPPAARGFTVFGSWSAPSIGASGTPPFPGAPILEIVDIATPARPTSWGRIKALYR